MTCGSVWHWGLGAPLTVSQRAVQLNALSFGGRMKLSGRHVLRCPTVLIALLVVAPLVQAEPVLKPPQADPSIWMVRSHGNHRIIIQQVCNPAHCATRGFVEVLAREYPRKVVVSLPITELNSKWWAFVERVEVVREGDRYHFDLYAVDTHGTEAGFTLRITPGEGAKYEANMRDFRSGADPP